MSVSELTEGLKKKVASLGIANPSVSLCSTAPRKGEPFGVCFTSSHIKPPSLRDVDASEASRRRESMRPERPNHLLQLCCLMYSSD